MHLTYLESILSRETLITMIAGKGLDRQMDSLVSFEIVIPVEALWALVAFEWPIVGSGLLVLGVAHEVRHGCRMTTIEARHHTRMHAYQREPTVWILHV